MKLRELLERPTWCICGGSDACIGCLIERHVKEYYGTDGLKHLRDAVSVSNLLPELLAVAEAAENYLETHDTDKCEYRLVNGYCTHRQRLRAALAALREKEGKL